MRDIRTSVLKYIYACAQAYRNYSKEHILEHFCYVKNVLILEL